MSPSIWKKCAYILCTLFSSGWVLYLIYIVFSGRFIFTFSDIALLFTLVYIPLLLACALLYRSGIAFRKKWNLALYICLVFNCVLLYGLMFRNVYLGGGAQGVNLIPFWSILFKIRMRIAVIHILYQCFLFVPLALNLLLLYPKFGKPAVFWGSMIMLLVAVEALQFFMGIGYCNIDDVLLATLGCFLLRYVWVRLQVEQKLIQLRDLHA